jgi:hypothetical protein
MTALSLPVYVKILLDGYKHERESALLRTGMESGPPKQAKIKSRVMVSRTCNLYLDSKNDFEAFELWYSEDLKEGANWFTYFDPVSGLTKTARFVGGGYSASPKGSVYGSWVISTKIETWG